MNKFEATKAKEEGKLVFLGKIKSHFGAEDYLLMNNGKLRQKITQLRLASHKLEIELGRHKGITRDGRTCMYCRMGKVESEEHFLFECTNYEKKQGTDKIDRTR